LHQLFSILKYIYLTFIAKKSSEQFVANFQKYSI